MLEQAPLPWGRGTAAQGASVQHTAFAVTADLRDQGEKSSFGVDGMAAGQPGWEGCTGNVSPGLNCRPTPAWGGKAAGVGRDLEHPAGPTDTPCPGVTTQQDWLLCCSPGICWAR